MQTSYNGWPAPPAQTRKWIIPGAGGRHLVLADGPAGFVLAHLALWFHEAVERLDRGTWDEWGYAYRPVRGSTLSLSCHASGTAADLNATRHPMGKRGTFTERQAAAIRRRLRWYAGVIRWGGDYQVRPDEMHFEVMADAETTRKLARRLASTPRGRRILAANPGARRAVMK